MGKKKKSTGGGGKPRPRFRCPKCGQVWVSDHEPVCIICDEAVGEALNEGAEKLLKKLREGKSINYVMRDAV